MKRFCILTVCVLMLFSLFPAAAFAETDADVQEQLETELGAFEIYAEQCKLAAANEAGYPVLDAGKGNCNWINTQARYAFIRFSEFSLSESERTMCRGDMAGQAQLQGIGERFDAFMDPADETDAFLLKAVDYCVKDLKLDREALIKELADACAGDYYPTPSRCLINTEKILNAYLQKTLYNGTQLAEETDIFPTAGGTGAICNVFNSLVHNRVFKPGDKIAIAEPIFTPYLQIPNVNDYQLVTIDVMTTAEDNWDISDEQLKKLESSDVKAFFLANPSNPSGHALSAATVEKLCDIVKKNPELIIITDDVYGAFVDDFKSIYSSLPHNTILLYSFSKVYGVTGWRVGLAALNKNNVVDELIRNLPEKDKEFTLSEYAYISADPENMKFIDRMVADSCAVGLYTTSGLSTPQQAFMDFLALTHLVWEDEDPFVALANDVVHERYTALMEALELTPDESVNNSMYYVLVNIYDLAEHHCGEEFAAWLEEDVGDLGFLTRLAEKKGVVLMYGKGFGADKGTVRICLSNLEPEDFRSIGARINELMDEYELEMKAESAK